MSSSHESEDARTQLLSSDQDLRYERKAVEAAGPAARAAQALPFRLWHTRSTWILGGAVFVVSFLFRFMAQPNLTNDFFVHVAGGRQMLLGEWPVRDFVDLGLPLMFATSAVAEWIGGYTLLSEVTVALVFMSLGAVLVFVLATEVSRSRVIGLLVTLPVVLVAPRLYAYPKLFCYPLAVWAMWRYLDKPTTARVLVLAAVTAVAFLFRHDHGIYIGTAIAAMLVVRHWPCGVVGWSRIVGAYALVVVLFLSPHLVFVQIHGGLISYVQTGVEFSRADIDRVWPKWVPSPAVRPWTAEVQIRWSPAAAGDDVARKAAEQRYGLSNPEYLAGTTWHYDLGDFSRANVGALIADPVVEDTQGIDRSTLEVRGEPLPSRLKRQVPLLDGAAAALAAAYAIPILFYLVYALPLAAIGVVVYRRALRRETAGADEAARIIALACLALLANVGMLRDPLDVRLADVLVLPAIVGAWLVGAACGSHGWTWARLRDQWSALRAGNSSTRSMAHAVIRGGSALVAILGMGVACVAAASIGHFGLWIERAGFEEGVSAAVVESVTDAHRGLSTSPPVDGWLPPSSRRLRPIVRYLHDCTNPTDRVFVSLPDVAFFSGRGFAGGHGTYDQRLHTSLRSQRRTVERLQRQSVPVALLSGGMDAYPALVADHFRQWYRPVRTIEPLSFQGVTVLVDRRRVPSGHYAPLDAPCFS